MINGLVPGIDVTDDPLGQARLFSYIDTQLTRLGGPNFGQIPINRPHAPVNDMFRDGLHQHADHAGVAPYRPNSLDGGCPFVAGADLGALVEVPQPVSGRKVREAPASFDDHFSQPRLFWLSMTDVERDHIVLAYTFEIGKCYEQAVKERQLIALASIDPELCGAVAQGLGLPAPEPSEAPASVEPSPALSQLGDTWPPDGRTVAIVADESTDLASVRTVRTAVHAAGMVPLVVSPHGGMLDDASGDPIPVQRMFLTARSVEFDVILVAGVTPPAPDTLSHVDAKSNDPAQEPAAVTVDPRVTMMLGEAYRHAKVIGGWGDAGQTFELAGIAAGPGVVLGEDASTVLEEVQTLMANHRVWERFPALS